MFKYSLKSIVANITLIVGSVLVTLVLFELAARILLLGSLSAPAQSTSNYAKLRRPEPELGWTLKPDLDVWLRTIDYSVRYLTNSKGFNDIEHTYEHDAEVTRIVVLGDSFMEAYQVSRHESFPRQLSEKLNGTQNEKTFEVINLGVGGYGTTQEYLMLQKEGVKYTPDIVLLGYLPANDVHNNHPLLEAMLWRTRDTPKVRGRPFAYTDEDGALEIKPPDAGFLTSWQEKSAERQQFDKKKMTDDFMVWYYVDRMLERWKDSTIASYDPNVWMGNYITKFDPSLADQQTTQKEYKHLWAEANAVTWELLKEIRDYSEASGALFCIFTIPAKFQLDHDLQELFIRTYPGIDFYPDKPNVTLHRMAEKENLCLIDLLPAFRAEYVSSGKPLHHQYKDRHWNKRGHALAAQIVTDHLIANQGELPGE